MTRVYMAGHAFLKRNNKYLLLQRTDKTRFMPKKWDIPGGTVEVGETVEEAIKREFQEEVSLDVNVLHPIYIHTNLIQMPQRQTFQAIYVCEYLSGEIKLNPREHVDFAWVDASEMQSYDLISFLIDFIKKSGYQL